MFTSAVSLALLAMAGSSAALPLAASSSNTDPQAFTMISIHSGDINVHLRPIAASGGQFFLGKQTSSYCPESVGASCPAGNSTSVAATPGGDSASMNVVVPGGQQVFVHKTQGYLGFTPAHSVGDPENQIATGFSYTPGASQGQVGNFGWENGFTACPVDGEEGVYQVKGVVDGVDYTGCTGIAIGTTPFQGAGAWQYS